MSDKICPDCGGEYNPSYRKCPYCEEEKEREKMRRKRGREMDDEYDEDEYDEDDGEFGYYDDETKMLIKKVAFVAIFVIVVLIAGISLGKKLINMVMPESDTPITNTDSSSNSDSSDSDTSIPSVDVDSDVDITPDVSEPTVVVLPITLSHTDYTAPTGYVLDIEIDGGVPPFVWSSDKTSVATVDQNGTVTATGGGQALITVTDSVGQTSSCIARITGAASSGSSSDIDTSTGTSGVTLNRSDITLSVNESFQFSATGGTVVWNTSDSSVASLSGSGMVTGVSAGTATITASVDGQSASCIVRVK